MTNLNPRFLVVFAFLLIGLIWSGWHIAWLVTLGAFIGIGLAFDQGRKS